MVTWHLTMKLFHAKFHERATLWNLTSNGKQFTVTREMLTAVACHLSIKWKVVFHRFDPFVLLYNKLLDDWSLGEQWILFHSNLNVSPRRTLRFSGNKIHCSPGHQSLSVNWFSVDSSSTPRSCMLVNIQLVCLPPIVIFKLFMFSRYS